MNLFLLSSEAFLGCEQRGWGSRKLLRNLLLRLLLTRPASDSVVASFPQVVAMFSQVVAFSREGGEGIEKIPIVVLENLMGDDGANARSKIGILVDLERVDSLLEL